MSLRDYVAVVRRRKWIIIQAAVVVPIVAVLWSLRGEPLYAASAEVLLSRQNLALTLTGTADPLATNQPERISETQARLARVPDIVLRVLAETHSSHTVDSFLRNSSVSPQAQTDILQFNAYDGKPSIAVRLANAYAGAYVAYRRRLDTASLRAARTSVERQIKALEDRGERSSQLYGSLVEKAQQLETIEALQTSNASVVRRASEGSQVAPRPKRSAVLGIVFGLVLGLGLAFLREALDTRVRATEDIERALGLPLLGRIAAPPRHLQRANRLVMLEEPRSKLAEAFRILRTNLEFFNVQADARTILVTSAVSEEGKSTTVANLAVALAAAGRNVILVDLDLRRPMIRRYFDFDSTGLAVNDVLQGRAQLESAHVDAELAESGTTGRVEILHGRPLRGESLDLLAGDQVDRLFAELKERADYVLIDAPPLLLVGDAMQLSAKVDAVLVMTRLNVVRKQMLHELRRALDATPAAKLGFVVTGADAEPDYKYTYSYYYYGYGQRARERRR